MNFMLPLCEYQPMNQCFMFIQEPFLNFQLHYSQKNTLENISQTYKQHSEDEKYEVKTEKSLQLADERDQKVYIQRKGRGHLWSEGELTLLLKYYRLYDGDWSCIIKHFRGRTASQCSQKYRKMMRKQYIPKRQLWTQDEDERLIAAVKKYGRQWKKISQDFQNRDCKSIRDRFINQLDPSVTKQAWTSQDDQKLLELYSQYGKKWTSFRNHLGNRSESQIKNRFYFFLKKRLLDKTDNPMQKVESEF